MSACDDCTTKSPAQCAVCLGLEVPPAGPPLDPKGLPIEPGARVYVRPRPGLAGGFEVGGFGGFVISATTEQVEIEEFQKFNLRTVRPADVRVKKGLTKVAVDHRTASAALRGTTQTKRGLKKIAAEAQAPAKKEKKE